MGAIFIKRYFAWAVKIHFCVNGPVGCLVCQVTDLAKHWYIIFNYMWHFVDCTSIIVKKAFLPKKFQFFEII